MKENNPVLSKEAFNAIPRYWKCADCGEMATVEGYCPKCKAKRINNPLLDI